MFRRSRSPVLVAAVLMVSMGLRLAPWGQNRFLEDEALYAAWGLQIATGADPMLDGEPVDKPPLYPYVPVSYTHLRAHETVLDLVCRLLLEKKKERKLKNCHDTQPTSHTTQ